MTFTATAEPLNLPPRIRLDVDTDTVGTYFTDLTFYRDGSALREQPLLGAQASFAFDYEMPYDQIVSYRAVGEYVSPAAADWTENWASMASWGGSGVGSWSTASAHANSSTYGAKILRAASNEIESLSVDDAQYIKVDLIDGNDGSTVVSITSTDKTVVVGSGTPVQTSNTGSYDVLMNNGTVTVSGSGWSVTTSYSGMPAVVYITSLGRAYQLSSIFNTDGGTGTATSGRGIAVDASGNIFLIDKGSNLLRKLNSSGVQIGSVSTVGEPRGVALDGTYAYVTDAGNKLVRKFNMSTLAAVTTWSTTEYPYGIVYNPVTGLINICRDATGHIGEIRKYTTTGTVSGTAINCGGIPRDIAVDSAGANYVTDSTAMAVKKYNSAGTLTMTITIGTDIRGVAIDPTTQNIFVGCGVERTVRIYSPAGVFLTSFTTADNSYGITFDSAQNVYVVNYISDQIRKSAPVDARVGQIVETPAGTPQSFDETVSSSVAVDGVWLLHPASPSLSVCVQTVDWRDDGVNIALQTKQQTSRPAVSTAHTIVGRPRPVVITTGDRQDGLWSLVLYTNTTVDRDSVIALITDQTPLLLRSPTEIDFDLPDGWYSVGDVTEDRVYEPLVYPHKVITLPLQPVDEPVVHRGVTNTWADVLTRYATWQDVLDGNDTWLDVLAGD